MTRFTTLLIVSSLALAGCAAAPTSAPTASAGASVTCQYRATSQAARPVDPPSTASVPATGTSTVTLNFKEGAVQVTLDRGAAPCTVHSFESLAQQGFYNDTRCHRIGVSTFKFLQCGDPTASGRGGPGYWFDDELAQTKGYPKGSVAMANSGPNTNGSQFFLVFGDASFPPNYTVFGTVDAAGIGVLEKIAAAGSDNSEGGGFGRPLGDSTIRTASVG